MVLFAFLGNTLFLTILVSMLSNTFSAIVSNAVQEIQFRRAVLTFEGVKSDAIFSYNPPFNILALVFLLPLKWTVSERIFHKIHVAAVRTLNLPVLLLIAWYERRTLWVNDKRKKYAAKRIDWKTPSGPTIMNSDYWAISRFSVHGDLHAVFEIDPPQSTLDRIAEEDDFEPGDPLGDLTKDTLTGHARQASRKNSADVGPSRRASVNSRLQRKRTKDSKVSEYLNKEFADSSDDHDEADHPTGYRKMRRGQRMDSIADFTDDGGNNRMLEATARLQKMEESMAKMEVMLSQLLGGDTSSEASKAEQELEEQTVV